MATRVISAAAAIAVASAGPHIDPDTTFGAFQGWGVSLAWWARTALGNDTTAADLLWTLAPNVTSPNVTLGVPGLGFSVARYNAGACSFNAVGGKRMVQSPNIPAWKQIPSFWLDPSNTDPSSAAWDWTADANQLAAATLAAQRGVTTFELFSNSPPWFLLSNLNPSGSDDGASDNLPPANYAAHALYMAEVARQLGARYNISFGTVEAFNEPAANWWKASGTQEGCHFGAATQAQVLPLLRAALDARGLTTTRIAASDESLISMALATWGSFNATTRGFIDEVNTHGYEGINANRSGLYAEAVLRGGKALRMSEHGDGDGSGLTMLANMHADFAQLHPTSWVYWQSFDSASGWTLVNADPANGVLTGGVSPKYFVLAQFTRHIRPGMVMLNVSDAAGGGLPAASTTAAWDTASGKLVVVASNLGGSAVPNAVLDLSAFAAMAGPVTRWVTQPSTQGGDLYRQYDDTPFSAAARTIGPLTWPANTVMTFEVEGVAV